ncbi:MAG: hypothetical protein FD133_684 [Erysipelotrichaceae bacterium]|nr:MAG: hypothetical protein FD179_417 [Erysipelotrichaceae bacterium]TXT18762.1 MAG: hypothetical protein FD133_684 [Erysipelotrichaceae bacterium]
MIKQDWKKDEKHIYAPKAFPMRLNVPSYKYLSIQGKGTPGSDAFQSAVEALFSLSYGLKFAPRKGLVIEGYVDYAVYPLEGLWDLTDEAKTRSNWTKEDLVYTLMIRQPDYIQDHHVDEIKQRFKLTKDCPYDQVKFEVIEDGECMQILHMGSFDTEALSFEIMDNTLKELGQKRKVKAHKEIYLSDFTKTKPENLKTILRIFIST